MSLRISIASGKGGTGKTSVAVNLFHAIAENWTEDVRLMDCDVEEPNDQLFFPDAREKYKHEVNRKVPVIETEKCTFCRACSDYCEFNAIVVIPPAEFASVNPELCHSCGACLKACEFDAITEIDQKIGEISAFKTSFGIDLMQGELRIGSAMQTMLINELLKTADNTPEVILIDAPPGTSCPVVSSVKDADYIILVAEPTPFGLNDLKLTLDILSELKKDYGVIINKDGLGSDEMENYLADNDIEILAKIPFSKEFAERYAEGNILKNISKEEGNLYRNLVDKLKIKLG